MGLDEERLIRVDSGKDTPTPILPTHQTKQKEVMFNLGGSQLEMIANLLKRSTEGYLLGDLHKWFFALKQIKLLIISRLTPHDMSVMKLLEKKISSAEQDPKQASKLIEAYDTGLKFLLEKRGFLVPLKKSRTALYGQGAK